jgi:DNA polymerase V
MPIEILMPIEVLGYVSCGFPSPAGDYMESPIDLNKELIKRPSSTFFFRVQGESMTGAFIPPDALLVVDRMEKPRHGSIVLAVVDKEFTVKRLQINGVRKLLCPENPKYKPVEIGDFTEVEIWGVVIHIITDAKTV